MKNKTIMSILSILLVCVCLSACAKNVSEKDFVHKTVEAKTPYFESLEQLEKEADVIVRGKKIEDLESLVNGSGFTFATLSAFELSEIIKDTSGLLEKDDIINVLENEYKEKNVIWHVADYTIMNTDDEYMLFLTANVHGEMKYYTPLGVNFGVTCLGEDYLMNSYKSGLPETDADDPVNLIREDVRKKYM